MPLVGLVELLAAPELSIAPEALAALRRVEEEVSQQQERLHLLIERASTLQAQIQNRLASSMNQIMYRFTWLAAVFLPLGFVTGLLGINVAGIPGDHNPMAFWLVCFFLVVVAFLWGVLMARFMGPRGR